MKNPKSEIRLLKPRRAARERKERRAGPRIPPLCALCVLSRRICVACAFALALLAGGSPAAADTFTDDFAAGLNQFAWQVISNSPLYTVDTSQGAVRFSKPAGGSYTFQYVGVALRTLLRGDFDVSVDFTNASITRHDGTPGNQVQLNTYFGGQEFLAIRSDEAAYPQNAHVWLWPQASFVGSRAYPGTSGRLRVTRTGAHVQGYVNDTLLYQGDFNTNDASVTLTLQNNGTRDATAVTFDNFTAAAASLLWTHDYTLDWWTVDGGGSDTLSVGQFTLAGTVGQPDASGLQTVGQYSLSGGYWAMFAPNPGTYYPLLTQTNGLTLWLAADLGVTNSGGRVTGWADQSGAGHDASQPNSGNQPTLVANQLNGLPVVRFGSGGDHFLNLAGQVIASQQFTILAVARDIGAQVYYRELISNWSASWAGNSIYFGLTGYDPVKARLTDDFGGPTGVGAVDNSQTFFILTGVSGTNSVAIYQNTRAIAWRGSPLIWRKVDGLPYLVGRQGASNWEYWRGDIAELLVYSRELPAEELIQVWQYLGDKYLPGAFVWPAITSATSATGRVNRPFSYTITATGSPAGYGASGLPAGLSVNSASGLISGAPGAAGTFNVSLSATNITGVGTTTLLLTIADNTPAQWAGNGHWYQAVWVGAPGITWPDASAAATNAHGYLTTITSAGENAFVYSLVTEPIFWNIDYYGNGIGPWLGGLQPPGSPEPAGNWQWVTGEPMSYKNWASGEPNNVGGVEDRLIFVGLGVLQSPQWADISGSALLGGYIIEYPQLPGAPKLSIALSNAAVIVSWPAPADDWLLERTNVLTGVAGTWAPVPPPYQTNNGVISASYTNAPPVGNQFFRLHRP